jgi:hypothetical protein
VNFGIHNGLIVDGNAVDTARNILAHETTFRVGIVGDLFYCVGTVVLVAALYVILEPVSLDSRYWQRCGGWYGI